MAAEVTPVIALAFTVLVLMIVFAFTSVVIWADARRKEREALYRSELLKKLAEGPGPGAEAVLASLREEEQRKLVRRWQAVSLGGVICLALGIAGIVAHLATPNEAPNGVWAWSFLPMFLGAAVIVHARLVTGRARADRA